MFLCPRCRDRLVRTDTPHGVFFVCRGCQGRAVALSVVRRMAGRKPARTIWIEANQEGGPAGVGCPICSREMVEVALPLDHEDAYLDVCIGCQFVWFDPKELEQLPEPAPTPTDEESLPEEVREQIAVRKAKLVAERAGAEDRPYLGPAETWKWIPGVLGMPVECEVTPVRRYTWVTWGLAAALAVVYLLTYRNVEDVAFQYGLIPAETWRKGGLTLLTSFFLHGGIWHLIANTYFLLVFGDNVEDYLGRVKYVLLLLAAAFMGSVAHVLGDPNSAMPCIGASGGISGVITFYALRFPEARLGILLRYWLLFRWLYMPAWIALILWFGIQFLMAFLQLAGVSHVSALAHLGGAGVGVLAWIVWRQK